MATFSIFFFILSHSLWASIGLRLSAYQNPLADFIKPDFAPPVSVGDTLNLPIKYPQSFQHKMQIDSTGESASASFRLKNYDVLNPRQLPFDRYLAVRSQLELERQWRQYAAQNAMAKDQGVLGGRGITIETAEIKSKAFRRVFGGGSIGLKVTGEITIDGNMRNEKKSQVKTALNRGPSTNFQMKQTQRFKVEGKIGENVTVFVDQDSERPFEFENAIKLTYSSDEDGVVQSIEAGNVALSLPGTRFVTFSSQSSGLFGIKSKFKVGNLNLTTIASMEKGKKNTLTMDGGKVEEKKKIEDYQYKKNTYFFLDLERRSAFQKNMAPDRTWGYDSTVVITEIHLYKSDYSYDNKPGAFKAWAVVDPETKDASNYSQDEGDYNGHFVLMDPSEYYVNTDAGFIFLNMPLSENEVLAAAYRDLKGRELGDLAVDTTGTILPELKMIKPQNPRPDDNTWDLEWKNVYSLGGRDIEKEGFELKIYYKPPSGDPQEAIKIDGENKGLLEVFDLDQNDKYGASGADNIIDFNDYILDLQKGLLFFPDLKPFDPEGWGSTSSSLRDDYRTPEIYEETVASNIRLASKFYIEVNSASRSPNLNLGINIIENSEEVLMNSSPLKRDVDYVIDYFSGNLTLLNEAALSPTAKIEVNYESQQMFSIDKKTLLGARAEYTLWETAKGKSFIGGTFLYLNQTTLDQRVRIGQDSPMRNMIWDVNTAINFEPEFMTKAFDRLPYLNAQGTTTLNFEGEIAQVIPNPNTLNNDATGDHDGVAYLDDFEGAKRDISLGVMYTGWGPASIPSRSSVAGAIDFPESIDESLEKKGHLYWYNPYEQVLIAEIWPDREVTTAYGGTDRINVLGMVFRPNPDLANTRESWGGIMTSLSSGYANQSDTKFLEIWVKGDHGRLNIDLGWISEDVIPNRDFDSEDKLVGGFRNDLLDEGEDTGIDGVFGNDPADYFHPHETAYINGDKATPYDFWDLNGDKEKQENEPWSYDNWDYESQSNEYNYINGYEANEKGSVAIYPNSEDLNGNTATDLINDYFEFSFSLDKNHPDANEYIVGGQNNTSGWRQYRIPLNDPAKIVGNPDWSDIRFARIWIDDVDINDLGDKKLTSLEIAEINLVGNEWKFAGVADTDSTEFDMGEEETFSIEVINTHENSDIYTQPQGVEGVIDPVQKIRSREQSLVLKMNNLMPGETAIAQKTLYSDETLLNYKNLKMFVHGGDGLDHSLNINMADGDTLDFFLRLGSGNNNENYYEIRMPVYDNWDARNEIEVDFEDFSRLKLEMEASAKDTIVEKQPNGHTFKISKQPSLSRIRWMIAGVKNRSRHPIFSEVWLDELRITNVRKEKGMAMRAKGDIRLADIFSINGEYNRKDADFHTLNARFGQGSNSRAKSLNASLNINKFLPANWGISIPVSVNYSESQSIPKWLPGKDVLVNRNTVRDDSLWNAIQSLSERKGINVSLRKSSKSRNFFLRYLVDPFRTSMSYSLNEMSNSTILYNDNTQLNGSLGYSLSFGNQNYFQPFKWLGSKRFVKPLSGSKFYYLPSSVSVDMKGTETDKDSETRSGILSRESSANFTRTFSTNYKPIQALALDYTRTLTSDMRNAEWMETVSTLEPGQPRNISQRTSANLSMKFISWLNPSLKVSSNYRWDDNPAMAQSGTGTNTSVNTSLNVTGNFNPDKFLQLFKKKSSSRRTTSGRAARRPSPGADQGDASQKSPDEEKKFSFPILKIFSFGSALFKRIDPISISYTRSETDNHRAIIGTPSTDYQWGLTLDPGVSVHESVGANAISKKYDGRYSFRSGYKITSQISLNFNYDFSDNESRGTQVMGTITKSALLLKNVPTPFPNWSVTWRGLEKIPFLSKFLKSASVTHSFSGRQTQTWSDKKSNITQTQVSKDFRPLVGANLTFKNQMTANVQYQSTVSITEKTTPQQTDKSRQTSSSLTAGAKYAKRGGMKLPFFKGRLDNNIDFALNFTMSANATEQNKGDGEFQEMSKTANWSLKPQITYTFTQTVRGGSYLELGERKDKRTGNTKITAFGINATISLSGR